MGSFLNLAMENGGSAGEGGGPDDDFRFPARTLRSHGFLATAFGIALGLTLMIFFCIFSHMDKPPFNLKDWITQVNPNLWFTFLFGFIGGTLLSAIYNGLLFRRLNLFGLDKTMD
jgi:hypothetical protein